MMDQDEQIENIQHRFCEFDEKKRVAWECTTEHKSRNAKAHLYPPATKVVPVIFLPGIMGSNLKHKDSGESVWRIRSNLALKLWDALGWGLTGGKRRRELLNPNAVVTDFDQKVSNSDNESTYFANSRQKRGWGSALEFSYAEPLEQLQKELLIWEDYYNQARKDGIGSAAAATEYFEGNGKGSKSIFQHILGKKLSDDDKNPLSIKETTHYRSLLLPLHVFGYNWLQDNAQSAQELANYIDNVLMMYNTNENGGVGHGLAFEEGHEKVILVTHSMGGLVSRYASELLKTPYKNKILGIVHGVMPDLGSPTAYKMMKIGEHSFPMSLVLGASATRLMSVLAQSPAPMQLLPSPKYNNGQPWLRIEKGSPDGVTDLLLPQNGDPFEEIYLKDDVWWRMYEQDILDKEDNLIKANFIKYKMLMIKQVMPFIEKMNGHYHTNTYQFYGAYSDINDTKLAKDERRSDETVMWKLQSENSWLWVSDDSRATTAYGDKREYTLLKSNNQWSGGGEGGNGDGTVPELSINLNASSQFKAILKTNVGHQDAYKFAEWKGDGSYGEGELSPAIKFTLRSLCRILQTDEVKP
ncbi:lipase family alpha/beta hydrolase [Moellerella wisconsensis]|uniref:lipase family alpha/beta hydrolase n=1 Tax=Moellerella wisconsensis TaxID=158849 RepID=UPI001F4EBDBB|nr:hypothetical protein [Moellerella wisconsensis]UNH23500.1 hypothetical protein MNY68_11835 [Moellerella wisconsensis]